MSPSRVAKAIASTERGDQQEQRERIAQDDALRALRKLAERREHRVAAMRQTRAHGRPVRAAPTPLAEVVGGGPCSSCSSRGLGRLAQGLVVIVRVVAVGVASSSVIGGRAVAGRTPCDRGRHWAWSQRRRRASVTRADAKRNGVHKNDTMPARSLHTTKRRRKNAIRAFTKTTHRANPRPTRLRSG